jgi:thioredoxin 1
VTDQQFADEVLREPGTVLVDFYTPYCPPCRQAAPVLEALCVAGGPNFKVVKIDAHENARTAAAHDVLAVPTFILFRDGKKLGQITGFRSRSHIERWIDETARDAEADRF